MKAELKSLADEVLECMKRSVEDQNLGRSLIGLFSAFDVLSGADYEKMLDEIKTLYDVYGTVILQTVKET